MRLAIIVILCGLVVAHPGECAPKKKAAGQTAFLQSLVVPGWGQYSLGSKNSALGFLGSELAMIGGIMAMRSFSNSTRDDYTAMARIYAGVIGDHSHDFYVDIGNWMTTDQFNEQRLRDRQYDALYRLEDEQWSWDSEAHREEFKKVRIRSDRVKNDVIYLVGGLVLNHVVSAIHAGRLGANKAKTEQSNAVPRLQLAAAPIRESRGMVVHASVNLR